MTKQNHVNDFLEKLKVVSPHFDFTKLHLYQRSEEWYQLKLGVISASDAHKVLSGDNTAKRKTYMAELIGQITTGIIDEINAKQLEWGLLHEDAAISAYEMFKGEEVARVPFVYQDDSRRCGCSPDAMLKNKRKGLELKCPFKTSTHIEFLIDDKIKSEYIKQCQFSMWITGFEEWDFMSYDPRMKKGIVHLETIERDEKTMKSFSELVPKFIEEMDKKLETIGFKFGQQWSGYDTRWE